MRLSTNAQQYVATHANLTFTFYVAHRLTHIEPRSGFVTGWTTVMLHGVGLLQPRTPDAFGHPMGLHCKFGDHIVTATVSDTNASCVPPSDAIAGAGLERSGDDLELHGSARRHESVIQLTETGPLEYGDAGPSHYGYAILPLPVPDHATPADAFQTFAATFRLLIDPDGFGASFSYGDLPDELFTPQVDETYYPSPTALPSAALGEAGGGAGLRVLFLTSDARRILVLYDGEQLGSCALPTPVLLH